MLDERTLKRKVLLRTLGSPLTILPFMIGITTMTAAWAFGWQGGLAWFAGLAGLLGSGGAFITKLLLSGDQLASRIASELRTEEQQAQQTALDDLDRRLTISDQDPRPETALRDLRELLKVFKSTTPEETRVNITSIFDIQSMASQLFHQCVRSLEQTDKLWHTAQKLNSTDARTPILQQREELIADVQTSIKHLSDTLVKLQTLSTGDASTAELKRIREELDHSLAIAKRVDARMSSLVKETGLSDLEPPLQFNQQRKGN